MAFVANSIELNGFKFSTLHHPEEKTAAHLAEATAAAQIQEDVGKI